MQKKSNSKKYKNIVDNRKSKWYNKQAVAKQRFFRKDEKDF